jgi:hypothetical protein
MIISKIKLSDIAEDQKVILLGGELVMFTSLGK